MTLQVDQIVHTWPKADRPGVGGDELLRETGLDHPKKSLADGLPPGLLLDRFPSGPQGSRLRQLGDDRRRDGRLLGRGVTAIEAGGGEHPHERDPGKAADRHH
jgi:hypothetical protein